MHENRHFLSYRKRRHDAENYVHICALRHSGESLQNGQQPQGNRRVKNPVPNSKDEAPTPLSVVGLLFISSLLFHLSRDLLRAWRFSLFRSVYLAFTTGQTSSGTLPFIGCFILFSQFILVCFIICKKNKKFFSSQFNRLAISWPPLVRVWGWASYRFLPFTVFSLGLPFCFSSYIVIYDVRVRGVVSILNETSHSFFVWGSS